MQKALTFMDIALKEARAAALRQEPPVGAVVVLQGEIIATAGNRVRELADPTAHAEILALREACRTTGRHRLDGADLHVTLEPCAMCAGAIVEARIQRLYYGAEDPKGGAVDHGIRLFGQPTCHHRPEVYGGINESRCSQLLKDFFSAMRQ